ncbi:integrase [Polynucleobacter tropicus]|uniref:Integrase n=1 Tax=Polynucleobacter tropicus TaxID=1743174 RepID=A0A6M9Q7T6_9BURK|nr:phage integrase SAM-like domain-containing protein [Polynucleobacter tropicus]QKM65593.1 integrase [Polynucleobacter tropicus]
MPKKISVPRKTSAPKSVAISDSLIHLRDGDVVLYKRENSDKWQARYKFKNKWHRISTKERNADYAGKVACEEYDRARFLDDEDIVITSKKFGAVAKVVAEGLQSQLDSGKGKVVYQTYITVINKYLIPFFKNYNINSIDYDALVKFDEWREKEMGKKPRASTITNHNTAINRVLEYAVDMGYMSKVHLPKLQNDGAKSKPRPTFSKSEYKSLTTFMATWCKKGHMQRTKDMRELLRDYVLILANTGMRHGTEALGLKWKDIEWITTDGERFLQFTVDGKTGSRTLIARHNTQDYLERIQLRNDGIKTLNFDALLKKRVDDYVFKLRDGTVSANLNGTFRHLMRDSGLNKNGANKTLYSLRHTYAHLALLEGEMTVFDLSQQMGTSVKMIEKYYGHVKPSHIARKVAGKRMGKHKVAAN